MIFITISFGGEKLKYDQGKSISYNEKNFLINMAQDCKDYGHKRGTNKIAPNEILKTYPKEVSFLFFKKHINDLCYYALSRISKNIIHNFKQQTEDLLISTINKCMTGEQKPLPKLCANLDNKATLFDLTVLLGSFCSKKSLSIFKKINCKLKKVGERECRFYQDSTRPLDKCPSHFSNKEEALNLYKSYFGGKCENLRWRQPKCLN